MRSAHPVALSPDLIRDGDPAALEELVRRRGTAVVAYAAVFGDEIVDDAVTETFARFRAAVHAQNALVTDQPDQLLLSCTRNSLSSMIAQRRPYPCSSTVPMLVAGAEQELGEDTVARLDAHIASCDRCREDRSRFAQAERAYRNGRVADVVPAIAARAVAAMVAAAPVAGADAAAPEVAPDLPDEHTFVEPLEEDDPFVPPADTADVPEHGIAEDEHAAVDPSPADTRAPALHRILLPVGIVTVAVVGAAAIAGVFGGTAPAPPGGIAAPPGPQPPARRPPADDATQRRAEQAARAALSRIEATDRRTTRAAAVERAAELAKEREEAREEPQDLPAAPGTTSGTATPGTRPPRRGTQDGDRPADADTRGQDEVESLGDGSGDGSGSGTAPEFEVSPSPSPTATP